MLSYGVGASLWAVGSVLLDPDSAGATVEVVDVGSLVGAVVGVLEGTAPAALAGAALFLVAYPIARMVWHVDRQDADLARKREADRDRERAAPPG